MARKSPSTNTAILVPIVLICGIGVFWMNRQVHEIAPTEQEEAIAHEKQDEAANKAVVSAPIAAITGSYGLAPESRINDLNNVGVRLIVGWRYDSVTQPNPKLVSDCLDVVKTFAAGTQGMVGVIMYDVDLPDADRSQESSHFKDPGVYIDGSSPITYTDPSGHVIKFDGDLGEDGRTPEALQKALEQLHEKYKKP